MADALPGRTAARTDSSMPTTSFLAKAGKRKSMHEIVSEGIRAKETRSRPKLMARQGIGSGDLVRQMLVSRQTSIHTCNGTAMARAGNDEG